MKGLQEPEGSPAWGTVKRTHMQTGTTGGCSIRKGSGFVTMQEQLKQEECRTLICYAQDFLARHSQSPESGEDLKMPEEPFSLRSPEWLKISVLLMFSLRMYPDCYRMTRGGRFTPSSARFLNWGIMWNGKCLTARISESHSQGRGCILSDILMDDVPEKYFLSQKQTEQLLHKSFLDHRGTGSTTRMD